MFSYLMDSERLTKFIEEKRNEINRGDFSEIKEVDEPISTMQSRKFVKLVI